MSRMWNGSTFETGCGVAAVIYYIGRVVWRPMRSFNNSGETFVNMHVRDKSLEVGVVRLKLRNNFPASNGKTSANSCTQSTRLQGVIDNVNNEFAELSNELIACLSGSWCV
jgi:hypothetical protein